MPRKITRILLRVSGALFLALVVFTLGLFFAVQAPRFQTWLGKQAGAYLSRELNTTIRVEAIRIRFFQSAHLRGVLALDQRHDTLFNGDLALLISHFDLKNQKMVIDEASLTGTTAKVIRYKGDKDFNFQFLADYFAGQHTTSSGQGWDVKVQSLRFRDLAFVYRDEKRMGTAPGTIDYDDIQLKHTNGHLTDLSQAGDTLKADIRHLSAVEKSGFVLENFWGRAEVSDHRLAVKGLRAKTSSSLVKGDIVFHHDSWEDYEEDFVNRVEIKSTLHDSTVVDTRDIGYFARELHGLDKVVALKGDVEGLVNDLHLRSFRFSFGQHTSFTGDLSINGLPDFSSSYMHVDAKQFSTSYADLNAIPDYPFTEHKRLPLPKELSRLGVVRYTGKLDGFVSDFTTYGTFQTGIGSATSRLSVRTGSSSADVAYKGRLVTRSFNLGALVGYSGLGTLDADVEIEGKGADIRSLDAVLEGEIQKLHFNGYGYTNITVNGNFNEKVFNGMVISHDPNADFDFNGTIDFHGKLPEMDFISSINHLNFQKVNFGGADSGVFSSQILIDISGDNIDNLSGVINLDNSTYRRKGKVYELSTFNILLEQQTANKKINLRSAYVNAVAKGTFELTNLPGAMRNVLYHYYPTLFGKPVENTRYKDQLTFKMRVKNFNSIVELFVPGLQVSANSRAEGDFDAAANKLNLQFNSPDLGYRGMRVQDLLVIVNENGNTVLGEVSGKRIRFTDSLGFSNFNFQVKSVDKDSEYNFEWDNLGTPANKGIVAGNLTFGSSEMLLTNKKAEITVNDSTWTLRAPNRILFHKNGDLEVEPMELANHQQVISAKGKLSGVSSDSLLITAQNVDLRQFNPLLQIWMLTLEGTLGADLTLRRISGDLVFNGDIGLSTFQLNGNKIGTLQLNARYGASEKHITMNGFTSLGLLDEAGNETKNITFDGTYHLDRKDESIDFMVSARPANLKVLNPFLEDIITIKNAFVNGEARVHGTPANVLIDGKFRLFNSEIKVDYTNVTYNITGDIEVMPDQIRFSDLLMREKGTRTAPQGTINGNIFHTNFGRLQIDYDVTYRNMLVLNTTAKENSDFYGRIYGTGNMGIYGFINNLHMQVFDTTTRNSQFILPLDGLAEIGESDFIHFVKKDTAKTRKQKTLTGFDLDMHIHATPDAQAQIILDQQQGDVLTAHGEGDLRLTINTLGKFEMFGDYIITNGNYLFTLENVINKKFEIEPGSSISWSGNPYNAEIDVVTTYRQRTSIAALLNDTTGLYKGRVPVECKLLISGRLFTPQIRFEVDFPTTDANARARIASVLSDEGELNRQVFSFLLFRSFVTPQIFNPHGGGVSPGGAAASTGSEMLSNRVSEFLNAYVGNLTGIGDLQLGLNYRPGSNTSTDAVDVALSKQFLNNKITVDGNFGVNNNSQMRNSGALIGDVNIDYKLSEDGRYRLKGFNRSNDNTQITTAGGPYTQGIGFFYREEFETFQQLFDRYLRKVKRNSSAKQ